MLASTMVASGVALFTRIGLPLNLLLAAVSALLIPVFWPFHP